MARQGDTGRNAEILSGILMYDKLTQEDHVGCLSEFLQPFSLDDQYRIVNHKLERYYGRTAVHLAAARGLDLLLLYLLRQGGDPNRDSSAADLKQTPLHIAAHYAHPKCIQVLLQHQGNLSLPNQRKLTPMEMIRGKPQCEEVVAAHLAKYREPDRNHHDLEIIDEMHSLAANPSREATEAFKGYFLSLKAHWQDLGVRFTDLNKVTLLCRVCDCQNIPLLEFLLERAPLEPLSNLCDQKTPLHIACEHNSYKMVSMLMEYWPELVLEREAKDDRTPLHVACQKCHRDIVTLLLHGIAGLLKGETYTEDNKLDLNIPDVDGNTPLHYACYSGACSEIVAELLGFRPSFPNYIPFHANVANQDKGRTILHVAVSRKKSNCLVQLLLQRPDNSIDRTAKAKPSGETVRYLTRRVSRLARRVQERDQGSVTSTLSESVPVGGMLRLDSPPPSHCDSPQVHTLSSLEEEEEEDRADSQLRQSPAVPFEKERKRAKSELHSKKDHSQPVLYITPGGELMLKPQDADLPQNCKLFSELQLTPLVEACALANEPVLKSLLMSGVRDRDERHGAKILQSLGEDGLLQLLLSFHCKQVPHVGEGETKMGHKGGAAKGLKLQWENAGLKNVRREWLVNSSFCPIPDFVSVLAVPPVPVDAISDVDLSRNKLTSLPIQLFQLPHLRLCNLSNNLLQSLPMIAAMDRPPSTVQASGWDCLELQELNLSSNSLKEIPEFVWKLPKLQKVLASQNKMEVLCRIEDREHLSPSLTHIDLSGNLKLQYVSDFLFQFPNISMLNLAHNQLQSLPGELWRCLSLEHLDVSHNQLRTLPCLDYKMESLDDSPSLARGEHILNPVGQISLRHPSQKLSREAGPFIRPLKKEREHDGQSLVQVHDPSQLRVLHLSCNALEGFPHALPCLAPNLQDLFVDHNASITEIDIAFIPQQLRKLQAGHNKIHSFGRVLPPDQQRVLRSQCHKPWEQTRSDCIHRRHQQLEQLEYLDLGNNCIAKLPLLRKKPTRIEESGTFSASVDLQASRSLNGAKPLVEDWDPEEVASPNTVVEDLLYPKLRHLDVSHNKLTGCFNPNVGFLRSLQYINVSNNAQLTHLPAELAYLRRPGGSLRLTGLYFTDLPALQDPPPKYQSVSLSQLMSYFRSQLKESVNNRTIKLMVVGREERGKTTLLRRLRQEAVDPKLKRTEGIDIHDWAYPVGWKTKFSSVEPVTFLTWDFAGQEQYYATHQCFYSKRSLYLVVFRLSDGEQGIHEVDEWMRNIQICAAGSPVILVGTHLDKVGQERADDLLKRAWNKYKKPSIYPNLVATAPVSSIQKNPFAHNGIETLRSTIYNVACHLFVGKQDALHYNETKSEKDPEALFQQRIPKEYLTLQESIREKLKDMEDKAPVLTEREFKDAFSTVIKDAEELDEAVQYLHNQGTILHFPDATLQSIYFLDPQWLTKMMANFIGPAKKGESEQALIRDGVADVSKLLKVRATHIPKKFQEECSTLLGKFGVILRIDEKKILIPSQIPTDPPDFLATPTPLQEVEQVDAGRLYRTLSRYWFMNFLPEGFWPRLICRLVVDQVLRCHLKKSAQNREETATAEEVSSIYPWVAWRKGLVWVVDGRPILEVKEVPNEHDVLVQADGGRKEVLPGDYRLEVHYHLHHCEVLRGKHCNEEEERKPLLSEATNVLVMVMQHLEALVRDWFPGVFIGPVLIQDKGSIPSYTPCWKCLHPASAPPPAQKVFGATNVVAVGWKAVYCFPVKKCVDAISQRKHTVDCPFHGQLPMDTVMPDLVFMDLYDECTSDLVLRYDTSKALGIGAFGVVLKGTWGQSHGSKESRLKVAVKLFVRAGETRDIPTILKQVEMNGANFYDTYNQIRTEVAVLSKLKHPNLTHLVGVTMQPHPALLLPLAPQGSLHHVLKEYSSAEVTLLPLTMQACARQMAAGLDYLHQNRVVHLDVKSGNVLVWRFPSANVTLAGRIQRASDVDLCLTDYGISRLSSYYGVRLDGPVGTPGYTAPELNQCKGLEISAEKGDVFSYAMTLSELLTFHPPFGGGRGGQKSPNELSEKIRNGERPRLSPKMSMSSPILLQQLMVMCWDALPQNRPSMAQALEEVSREEFPRLRYELCIKGLTSISTSCVFRVEPQDPAPSSPSSPRPQSFAFPSRLMDPTPSDHAMRRAASRIQSKPLDGAKVDLVHEMDIQPQSVLSVDYADATRVSMERSGQLSSPFSSQDGDNPFIKPHTQVWVCGRDYYQASRRRTSDRKGSYSILTFSDGELGGSVFTGFSANRSEITAMCYASYHVWMGTSNGELRIVDIVTHEARFVQTLEPSLTRKRGGTLPSVLEGSMETPGLAKAANVRVLAMVAVPEVSTVLVSTTLSSFRMQIWCFEDRLEGEELVIQQVLDNPDLPSVYQVCRVILPDGTVEVWGTSDHSQVAVFQHSHKGEHSWQKQFYESQFPNGATLPCKCITHAHFVSADGVLRDHVWVSTDRRCKLVCWDAQEKKQLFVTEVRKDLELVSGIATVAVRSLLASGSELFVGATNGVVGVYSAETGQFLHRFAYHTGDVRALMEIPLLSTPCVCAEVQAADIVNMGSISSIMDTPLRNSSLSSLKCEVGEGVSLHKPHPQEPLKPLILSIGNGHLEMQLACPTASANEQLVASLGGTPKLVAKGGQAPIYLQCWCR